MQPVGRPRQRVAVRRRDPDLARAADPRRRDDRRGAGMMLCLVGRLQRRPQHGPRGIQREQAGERGRAGGVQARPGRHQAPRRGAAGSAHAPHREQRHAGADREGRQRRPGGRCRCDVEHVEHGRRARRRRLGPHYEPIGRGGRRRRRQHGGPSVRLEPDRVHHRRGRVDAHLRGRHTGHGSRPKRDPERPPVGHGHAGRGQRGDRRRGGRGPRERSAHEALGLRPARRPEDVAGSGDRGRDQRDGDQCATARGGACDRGGHRYG